MRPKRLEHARTGYAVRGLESVAVCSARTTAWEPARVLSACWNGAHAVSDATQDRDRNPYNTGAALSIISVARPCRTPQGFEMMDEETTAQLLSMPRTSCWRRRSNAARQMRCDCVAWLHTLAKPTGGVRTLVTGDVFRRLVARMLAQQLGEAFRQGGAADVG